MMTEVEYINMLPDISKFQDVNESSFLKGMNSLILNTGPSHDPSQAERIRLLEEQLEAHRKQLDEYEEEKKSHSANSFDNSFDKRKETEDELKRQLKQVKKQHEVEMLSLKTTLKEELRHM